MDDATVREYAVPIPHDPDRGHHRCIAEALDLKRDLEFVVEARRGAKARPRLCHDEIEAVGCERSVGAEGLAPQLGQDDVEVDEVVGVEDMALDVALVVPNGGGELTGASLRRTLWAERGNRRGQLRRKGTQVALRLSLHDRCG